MKKNSLVLAMAIVGLLTMNFRCEKDVVVRPFDYTFEIPVAIYPLKKTYSLNDTIWLETDLSGKTLYDNKTRQNILVDSGMITLCTSFNAFGTSITNPANGFSEVTSTSGNNISRDLGHWGTVGYLNDFGCGQTSYRCRIGFKPNYKGNFYLSLPQEGLLGSCTNKVVPYYASTAYKFKNVDLNKDVFDALSKNDKGGNDGVKFYTDKIAKREVFVFKVE